MPRVLLVDDEPAVLETLAWGLRHGGYDVTTAGRFDEARRALLAAPPDALVTDVRLGAFNGLQLAIVMRDASATAPIIVLSGFDDPALRKDAERLGAVYLTKPLRAQELLGYLDEGLNSKGA